ncbi:hypothetical protein K438DRAFT_1781166 [Mycena galopus ATCC 62051]|nr:hypothetical protein K438DRAFT_1781166 [Mycena galopus ATCC 62051]
MRAVLRMLQLGLLFALAAAEDRTTEAGEAQIYSYPPVVAALDQFPLIWTPVCSARIVACCHGAAARILPLLRRVGFEVAEERDIVRMSAGDSEWLVGRGERRRASGFRRHLSCASSIAAGEGRASAGDVAEIHNLSPSKCQIPELSDTGDL